MTPRCTPRARRETPVRPRHQSGDYSLTRFRHGEHLLQVLALTGWCLLLMAAPTSAQERERSAAVEQRVARHLDRIRQEPPALRAFLQALPKGADLHTHLSGAVYAESYIQWAAELSLCIDTERLAFVDGRADASGAVGCVESAGQRPAAHVLRDPALYGSVIDALSTRHWRAGHTAGHYQFFDAFQGFGAVARQGRGAATDITARSIAEVLQRAGLQNVLHLELMMSFDTGADASAADAPLDTDEHFEALRGRLLESGLQAHVAGQRRWLADVELRAREILGCGTASARRGCDVSVRFMTYALRGLPPHQVFGQALFAFELANADSRMAGVNLVMPEDWYIPMRDYELHMRIYRFLGKAYPGVNVALHAGELALGLVPPETLGRHVRQAIEVGGARRIGHGTDIMHDADPPALLADMARRRIAVEVIPTSSDVILGITGARHPLRQFLRAGVPVVIATDDEGVARSDLTNEYQRAVEEHGLSYGEIKTISLNSIEYSFLPADEKARVRQRLVAAFTAFEARYR